MESKVHIIDINDIVVNPNQPRLNFFEEKIIELANSIDENGLIQPVVVRKIEKGYELVAGERRLRATKHLNKKTIEAIIQNYDEKTSAKISVIENIQRENLSAIEEAVAYEKLIKEHGYSQKDLAQELGKSQSTVANKIRLLGLSQEVKNNIVEMNITERHGRALLKITDFEEQKKVLEKIKSDNLNVKNTEEYIESIIKPKEKPFRKKIISKTDYRLEINTIKKSLELVEKAGVQVEFSSQELDDCVKIEITLKK